MASEHALPGESQTQRSSPSPHSVLNQGGIASATSTTARPCSPARQGLRRSPWRLRPASTQCATAVSTRVTSALRNPCTWLRGRHCAW